MTGRHRGLVALAGVALIAGHVVVLHRVSSVIALPMEVALAAITIVVLVHLGVFRAVVARFRGAARERREP